MKKAIIFFLLFGMSIASLCGCQRTQVADIWDGAIAKSFAGGDGSENAPYRIETGSQLAFLAQEINAGKDYRGSYFVLDRDLNLNNIDWTPIGNGEHDFEGTFDGKGHTISNLRIPDVVWCKKPIVGTDRTYTLGITGLFGTCKNVSLRNLSVHGAEITVNYQRSYDETHGGVLIGLLETDSVCSLESIKILDANITLPSPKEAGSSNVCLGGVIGSLHPTGSDKQQCTMKQIESIVKISCLNGQVTEPNLGGIAGRVSGPRLAFECSDFHSDLTVSLADSMIDKSPAGAFGCLSAPQIALSNAFCLTKLDLTFGNSTVENAIVGKFWGSTAVCKNLFGRVMPASQGSLIVPSGYVIDDATREKSFFSLYHITEKDGCELTEENCTAGSSLPKDHGFDSSIWNLTDLSNPRLK